MSTTIALSPVQLQDLIESAVSNALQKQRDSLLSWIEEEEVIDRNLARLIDETRDRNEPTIPGEVFLANLKASL